MKHQIILPIINSPVTAFTHQAALLSILFAYKECKSWIFNNYIQLFSLKELYGNRSGTVDFYYTDYSDFNSYEYSANPWIRFFEFPLKSFWKERLNLEDFLYEHLEQGFYIQLEIDEYYISKYDDYQKNHYVHWMYIYGIDIENHQIFCLDNFKNFKFSSEKIPYEELYQGFISRYKKDDISKNDIGPTVAMFKVMDTCEDKENNMIYELDINRIVRLLGSYIGRYNYCGVCETSKYYVYGIEVYETLKRYISDVMSKGGLIDLRGFCALEDHKKLMVWRLQYIESETNCSLKEDIVQYEKVCKMMRIVVLLLLKYNITNNSICLKKASQKIEMIKTIEKEIIMHIMKVLERI